MTRPKKVAAYQSHDGSLHGSRRVAQVHDATEAIVRVFVVRVTEKVARDIVLSIYLDAKELGPHIKVLLKP